MFKIYLITGSTGSDRDIIRWSVCAYHSKEAAEERIEKMTTLFKELSLKMSDCLWNNDRALKVKEFIDHPDGDPHYDEPLMEDIPDYEIEEIDLVPE